MDNLELNKHYHNQNSQIVNPCSEIKKMHLRTKIIQPHSEAKKT